MSQVRLRFDFGELVVEFSSLDELDQKLDEAKQAAEIISGKVIGLGLERIQRSAKPGYEDVYRFLPDGSVELLLFPKKNVQKVALALFAYDHAVPVSLIEKSTNIPKVAQNVLTSGPNKKYFIRTKAGYYALSPEGISLIREKVIPSFRKSAPSVGSDLK